MAETSIKENRPDERFSGTVIEKLLSRPRLLEIERHPVRVIWDAVRAALSGYQVIETGELDDIERTRTFGGDSYGRPYQLDERQALRTQTTSSLWQAMPGRCPPVRLATAGRVFRTDKEDATHQKVFHQVDGLCIDHATDLTALKGVLNGLLTSVLGAAETRWRPERYEFVDDASEIDVRVGRKWISVAGAGTMKRQTLEAAGYTDRSVGGFAFGLGLERMAMIKFDISDIRMLWRPPYVGRAGD